MNEKNNNLMNKINTIEISKILISTTHVLSRLRFQPAQEETKNLLSDIGRFYEQKLNLWKHDEFLVLLDNFSQQDEVMIMCDFLSRNIKPTDNTDEVCFYSALISTICEDCCKLYDDKKFEQLSDIIDAIHGLPEALLYKDVWREKPFWKTYIDPYRRKWDKKYLKLEQKQIFKKEIT